MMSKSPNWSSINYVLLRRVGFFSLLIWATMWESSGLAIQVLPMEQEFDPQKTKNLEVVINNTNGNERAVEITLYARSQDEKGRELRMPSKDFFIIPRQTKILAGQHQTIKLIWQGSSELLKEQAYRLVVEQLPIDLLPASPAPSISSSSPPPSTEKKDSTKTYEASVVPLSSIPVDVPAAGEVKKSEQSKGSNKAESSGKLGQSEGEKTRSSKNQIEFLYKFVASIYARPSSATPKVEFEIGGVDEKKQSLKLVAINSGLAHQLLSHGQLILESDKIPAQKIALIELPNLYNLNLMAGSRVNIEIPWKEKHPPIKVSFDEKDH